MRAYKCDACGKVFLLPDTAYNSEGFEDDDLPTPHVPFSFDVYHDRGIATFYDICQNCGERIMKTIEEINCASKIAEDYRFVKGG